VVLASARALAVRESVEASRGSARESVEASRGSARESVEASRALAAALLAVLGSLALESLPPGFGVCGLLAQEIAR
jgi:hypothetical protein